MAFSSTVPIKDINVKTLALWSGIISVIGAGGSYSGLDMFNIGDIGALQKINITVGAIGAGATTLDVFWTGATVVDGEFDFKQVFWSSISVTAADTIFRYVGHRDGTKIAAGSGTPTEALYMFDVPYLGFGIDNTGGNDAQVQVEIFGELLV